MGTVIAIGDYDPNKGKPFGSHNFPGYQTTATGIVNGYSQLTTTRPSITFDSWDDAIKFAAVIAKQHRAVKVAKVADSWTVAWTDYGTPAINPTYPAYTPPATYPFTITYRSA